MGRGGLGLQLPIKSARRCPSFPESGGEHTTVPTGADERILRVY